MYTESGLILPQRSLRLLIEFLHSQPPTQSLLCPQPINQHPYLFLLSAAIWENIHQVGLRIMLLTMLGLGNRDVSLRATKQDAALSEVCPRELIISSMGKKAGILLQEQSENKLGEGATCPSPRAL